MGHGGGMLFEERERHFQCNNGRSTFVECVPIYVHTYFIRRPTAEYAIMGRLGMRMHGVSLTQARRYHRRGQIELKAG